MTRTCQQWKILMAIFIFIRILLLTPYFINRNPRAPIFSGKIVVKVPDSHWQGVLPRSRIMVIYFQGCRTAPFPGFAPDEAPARVERDWVIHSPARAPSTGGNFGKSDFKILKRRERHGEAPNNMLSINYRRKIFPGSSAISSYKIVFHFKISPGPAFPIFRPWNTFPFFHGRVSPPPNRCGRISRDAII